MIPLAATDYLSGVGSIASQLTYTIFGMELTNSTKAEDYKVLAQGQLPASINTLYTVGAGLTAFIKTIMIVNNDTATRTFNLSRGGTAATNRLTPAALEIPAGGMAIYEDNLGWQILNYQGQLLTTSISNPYGYNNQKVISGALYETFDRDMCNEVNTSVLSTGRLSLQAIWLPSGVTINSISLWSATTAGASLTNQLFGLYDNNLNLLRSSVNDNSSGLWAANSKKTLNLTSAFTTNYSGLYYIGVMIAGASLTKPIIVTGKQIGRAHV